jgi:hypothetical protein
MRKITSILAGLCLTASINAADIPVDPATTKLVDAYASAAKGDVLILKNGIHIVDAAINVTKGVTIKAENAKQATVKGIQFTFNTPNPGDFLVQDVILDATKADATVQLYLADFNGTYPLAVDNILFENCNINNFGNCMLRANRGEGTCKSFKINNCIIKYNGYSNAYPFFQTTKTKFGPGSLELTNSTIADFANEYIQNYATTAGADNDATYLFKNNTFYNTVTNSARKPFSFTSGKVYVQNNIFVKSTTGTRTLDVTINAAVTTAELTNNVINNFDAGALLNSTGWSANTGNQDVDPGFKDAANYDFTLPNGSALISAKIGDPRWFIVSTGIDNSKVAVRIYPNPTSDMLIFDKNYARVDVYSLSGNKVSSALNCNSISVADLMNGSYIAKFVDDQGATFVEKIQKK